MDFRTRTELNALKGEILGRDRELEAGKAEFAQFLKNSLGTTMMEELNNPPKKNILRGLLLRIQRWITIQRCKSEAKKYHKQQQYEQGQFNENFKNDFYE
jgi:hypothetical protein